MRRRFAVVSALVGLAAGFPGCLSLKRTPEARFFVLRSLAEPVVPGPSKPSPDLVGVLPAVVPGYLDRPQLVTWVAPGELRIDEYLRWAEPLDAGVSRTLVENLDALLPERRLVRWPWPATTPLRCRVRVELEQFGPQASGELRLEGAWAVLPSRGERPLVRRTVDLRRGAPASRLPSSPTVAGVGLMSELLLDLAREIAAAIGALPEEVGDTAPGR
jgi:uncharacterized lipoprotein YmbA